MAMPMEARTRSTVKRASSPNVHINMEPITKKHVASVSNQNKNLAGWGLLFIPHSKNTAIGITIITSIQTNNAGVVLIANRLSATLASSASINTNNGDIASPHVSRVRKKNN